MAVVNDGKHSVLYIEGCPAVDNAQLREAVGITQLGLPWALGGYEYGGSINPTASREARQGTGGKC